jgi:H+/Cl- antiporter ClcA
VILYRPLVYVLVTVFGALALLCLFIWRKHLRVSRQTSQRDDVTTWLLVGLLLIAGFSLGALVMYVVWSGH